MDELNLSQEEIKALSSETRVEVLKMLKERKHTLSEMSKKKGVAASSMKQQLEILAKTELINPVDEGRKWKYYELTPKGKSLLESRQKPMQITLLLSTTIMILGFIALLYAMNSGMLNMPIANQPMTEITETGMEKGALPSISAPAGIDSGTEGAASGEAPAEEKQDDAYCGNESTAVDFNKDFNAGAANADCNNSSQEADNQNSNNQ